MHFLPTQTNTHPARLRHLHFISQFTTNIWHICGDENAAADALSWAPVSALSMPQFLAVAQATDPELEALQTSLSFSLQSASVPRLASPARLICENSPSFCASPFPPHDVQLPAFPGSPWHSSYPAPGGRLLRLARHECHRHQVMDPWYQRSKTQHHTVTPLDTFAVNTFTSTLWAHFHPPVGIPIYLLTCTDQFSCWPEAFPTPDIIAETVALTLVSGWVGRFGMPSTITTSLRARTTANHWVEALPRTLLSIRTALKGDLQCRGIVWCHPLPLG